MISYLCRALILFSLPSSIQTYRWSVYHPGILWIRDTITSKETAYNITRCAEIDVVLEASVIYMSRESNTCVNLYSGKSCSGRLIRLQGNQDATFSNRLMSTSGDNLSQNPTRVRSAGPCFAVCDAKNWVGMSGQTVNVTTYLGREYKGDKTDMTISGPSCYPFPLSHKYLNSLKISGDDFTSCIELHMEASCGGDLVQLRPGYPALDNIYVWGTAGDNIKVPHSALAISRCGSQCNKTIPEVNPIINGGNGEGDVTVYFNPGFYGIPTPLNLSATNCTNLTMDDSVWTPHPAIITGAKCVVLYEDFNCVDKWVGSYSLQTSGKSTDYYVTKLLALTRPEKFRSLRLCSKDEEVQSGDVHVSGWKVLIFVPAALFIIFLSILLGGFVVKLWRNSYP